MYVLRRAALLCACAVLVVLAGLPGAAQFVPTVGYAANGSKAMVVINGRTAINFRVGNGGLTPLDRARITAGRLEPLTNRGWASIAAESTGRTSARVVAGKQLICMITQDDAKAGRMSAAALAEIWAKNLRGLLSMPPITLSPVGVTIPENETRRAVVGGALTGPVRATDSDPSIATSTFDPAQRVIIVRGKSVGRCTVEVSCQGYTKTLSVSVKRYAGRLTGAGSAEVTGNPAPNWLIKKAAEHAAASGVSIEPQASAIVGKPRVKATTLANGKNVRAIVPVRVQGPGMLSTELLVPVDVFNRSIISTKPTVLFYSNNPERITRYETLFAEKLSIDECTRLFYHHQNMLGKRAEFFIELINAGNTPASIHAISGTTPAMVDTVKVGYMAGVNFIRDYLGQVGMIYSIPPMSKLVIYAESLKPLKTASGIIDLRETVGGDVYIRVAANPPGLTSDSEGCITAINDYYIPSRLSDQVYAAPVKQLDVGYVVGECWQFIRIGKYSIRDTRDEKDLYGNYGVIYEIHLKIQNPTADASKVRLVFEPTAGPAAAVFVLDGNVIGVKQVNPPMEHEIMSARVPAGKSKEIIVLTMPLGGSAYPATLVVRP